MATKQKLTIHRLNTVVDGYAHNEHLGLYLDPSDNFWRAVHIATGKDLEGPSGRWKKKRSCLAFVEAFSNFDWSVETEEELYERNGGFDSLVEKYAEAVKIAEELE